MSTVRQRTVDRLGNGFSTYNSVVRLGILANVPGPSGLHFTNVSIFPDLIIEVGDFKNKAKAQVVKYVFPSREGEFV